MRQLSFFVFVFFFALGFPQAVNLYNPSNNVAYPLQQYFCGGETYNLTVDAVASSTGDYNVTSESPSNYPLTAGSTPITFPAAGGNKFSDPIPIGFTFSFYGKNYNRMVMGSNGRLVFTNDARLDDLKDVNIFTDRTFSGIAGYNTYSVLPSTDYNKVFKNSPTQELNLAQIFFGYTDLIPRSQNSSVVYLYKSVNVGTVKGLLVSFQNQIRTNGTGGNSSSTYNSFVILLEDGRIINYVNNKTEDTYNALLGIQNDDATKFKVPTHGTSPYNYNNGQWKSEAKAYVFTPNQALTPQFKWFRNGVLIPGETAATLSGFTPNDGDVLKIEVAYFDTAGNQVGTVQKDQVTFTLTKTPVITKQIVNCDVIMKISPASYDPQLTYEWYRVGSTTVISTNLEIYLNRATDATGMFYVKAKKPDGTTCSSGSESNQLEFLSEKLPSPLNADRVVCDNSATPAQTKRVNLYELIYPKYDPASGLEKYNVYFFEGTANTLITDPENYVLKANQEASLTFAVKDANDNMSCLTGGSPLYFISITDAINVATCSSQPVYNLKNLFESQFPTYYQFAYTYSDGTSAGDGTTVDTSKIVNIKTTISGASCSTNTAVTFTSGTAISVPRVPVQARCAGADNNANRFDFNYIKSLLDPAGQYDIKFYRKSDDQEITVSTGPGANLNAAGYFWTAGIGDYVIYAKLMSKSNPSCFANSDDIILRVHRRPQVTTNNPIVLKNCPGNSIYNLIQNVPALVNAAADVAITPEYYSQSGTLLTSSQVTNYDAAVFGTRPFIKLVYNPSCSDVINFDLQFYPKPTAIINQIIICEEINYLLQTFQNAVIANSSQYSFTDEFGNALPANFDVSVLPKTVNFLINDNSTGCISDVQSVSFTKGNDTVLLTDETDLVTCDPDFDGKTGFNLDSKKSTFTTNTSATFDYFKDVQLTQKISANYTNEIPFDQTIYAKITVPGFCPVVAKINLHVNTPTKSSTLVGKYFICYGETLTINAGVENVSWKWSTGETTATVNYTKPGNYSVLLTNSEGCGYTHNFTISDENQPKINVINQTNTSIEVVASGGAKPYKYYFNGVAQNANILTNPTASSYTVQVESASGCLGEPKTIYFIKINNAFSPNDDGINDYWTIENLNKMENISLTIVDRYGAKVFEAKDKNNIIWDGKVSGKPLPSSTYWYNVSWFDATTQKNEQRQGWILLKNIN